MKNKIFIISLTLMFLLTGCAFDKDMKVKYTNITYREENDGWACLTFYDDGDYSMYDCDSEPTNYFFDSEAECTYKYTGDKIKFKCKYYINEHKNNYIEIKEWDKSVLKFTIDGQEKVFYAQE